MKGVFAILLAMSAMVFAGPRLAKIDRPAPVFQMRPQQAAGISEETRALADVSKAQGEPLTIKLHNSFGTPRFLSGKLTQASHRPPVEIARDFLCTHSRLFKMNSQLSVELFGTQTDNLGDTHVRFRFQYQGVEVWPSEVRVHVNSSGVVTGFNGVYRSPNLDSVTPTISADQAVKTAMDVLAPEVPVDSTARLVVYDWKVDMPCLAYMVSVKAREVYPINQDVVVDALSGAVINRIEKVITAATATVMPYRTSDATAQVAAYNDNGTLILLNTSKPMFPGNLDPNTLAGTIHTFDAKLTNASQPVPLASDPNGDGVFNDNPQVRAAGAIAYWTSEIYDFFLNTFQRNSYDNNGAYIRMFANFRADPNQGFDNAFWNGQFLVFGDGGQFTYNWAYANDLACHEVAHAVCSSTADLIYQFQSGALNEGFSDIYASLFDAEDWLIGEDITTPAYGAPALRDMANPHQNQTLGHPAYQPAHMNEYINLTANQDNGGVHVNCSIINHAFYKLATAIGRRDAGQIIYRAEAQYLTRNSEFADMRSACEKSAADLFGAGSNQVQAVSQAFADVGIGQAAQPPGEQQSVTLYYPMGGDFTNYGIDYECTMYVTNVSDQPVTANISWFDANGQVTYSGDVSLDPHATARGWSDPGDQWIKVVASGPVIGACSHMNASGTSWSLIPATRYISNGMFVPHIATNTSKFWTVGGIANVADTTSSIVYGDNLSDNGIAFDINSVGQAAAFDFEAMYAQVLGGYPDTSSAGGLWGLFANFDMTHNQVLEYNLTGAEIFGRKEAEMAAGLIMDATSGRSLLFTHVAANTQTFWTGYAVVNVSDPSLGAVPVRIVAYDSQGQELANHTTSIPPLGKLLAVTGNNLVPAGTSWFLVSGLTEGTSLVGMELFGSQDDRQLAGFQATPYVGKRFFFPFVVSGNQGRPDEFSGLNPNWTGISIVNPNAGSARVSFRLFNATGQVVTAERTIAPNSKFLDLLTGVFGVTDFYGHVEITADLPVAGFSLCGFENQQELAGNPMVFLE